MRQISWKQSAVHQSLIVKQFDPVWQRAVLIALDTDLHGDFDEYLEQSEYCFSLARTVCEQLEQFGIAYELVTNAAITGDLSAYSSSGGMGGSFRKILYALGSAKKGSIGSVEELMHAVCSGDGRWEMVVLISTHRDERTDAALARAQASKCGQIITLFADQLMPVPDEPSGKEAAEA